MSKRGRKPGQGAGHHELRVETQLGCGLGLGQEAEGRGGDDRRQGVSTHVTMLSSSSRLL